MKHTPESKMADGDSMKYADPGMSKLDTKNQAKVKKTVKKKAKKTKTKTKKASRKRKRMPGALDKSDKKAMLRRRQGGAFI